jgi:hypothetical protein
MALEYPVSISDLYEDSCVTAAGIDTVKSIGNFYNLSCPYGPTIIDVEADVIFRQVGSELIIQVVDLNNLQLGNSNTFYWGFNLYLDDTLVRKQVYVQTGTQYSILAQPGTYTVDAIVYQGGQIVYLEQSFSSITID